jgi:outer membrane protein TolC
LRKYQEGQASLLELIDARTGLTSASTNVIVARTDYYTGLADFQFALGQSTYE